MDTIISNTKIRKYFKGFCRLFIASDKTYVARAGYLLLDKVTNIYLFGERPSKSGFTLLTAD